VSGPWLPVERAVRAVAAGLVLVGLGLAMPAAAQRVTDPNVINRFDTRFEVGLASPVGMVGGTLSVPWQHAAVDASLGWGLTGAQVSLMPKWIPVRWDRSALMVGAGATLAIPTLPFSYLGERRTFFQMAEVAWQRAVLIDNLVYVGLGVMRGPIYAVDGEGGPPSGKVVYWPALRVGWGVRR
jgi:hypothetical protein